MKRLTILLIAMATLVAAVRTAKERLIELWGDELNFKRWDILDEKVHQNYQALGSYNAEVGTVKTYINERLKTLDALIRR